MLKSSETSPSLDIMKISERDSDSARDLRGYKAPVVNSDGQMQVF